MHALIAHRLAGTLASGSVEPLCLLQAFIGYVGKIGKSTGCVYNNNGVMKQSATYEKLCTKDAVPVLKPDEY